MSSVGGFRATCGFLGPCSHLRRCPVPFTRVGCGPHRWDSSVQVRCGGTPAEIAVDQIRTVSKSRLGDKIGALNHKDAATLRRVITEMYGE